MALSLPEEFSQRPRFHSTQEWFDFFSQNPNLTGTDLLHLRSSCYYEIQLIRGRPLIVYASSFLTSPQGIPTSIDLTDIDGFTDLVGSFRESRTVDVLIHSGGGSPDATERIVNILRSNFEEVHFIIPHSAYSAATMMALSGDSITLHSSATLGPIDPQLEGIPARSITKGFERVRDEVLKEGPEALPAYVPLIEKYTLHLLEICRDSACLSEDLVTDWLHEYMFKGARSKEDLGEVVKYFSNYEQHLVHSRPLMFKKLEPFRLHISEAEPLLEYLIWEAYIMLNAFFQLSPFYKLFENTNGVTWGRQSNPEPVSNPQPVPDIN